MYGVTDIDEFSSSLAEFGTAQPQLVNDFFLIVLLFSLGLEIKNGLKTFAASLQQYGPVTSRGNYTVSKILVTVLIIK